MIEAKTSFQFLVHFYVTHEEIEENREKWMAWQEERQASMAIHAGSESYSGHRPVCFVFEKQEDAALFRLFFGGSVNADFVPTLSKDKG